MVEKTIILLEKNQWTKKKSIIYIEIEKINKKKLLIPKNWNLYNEQDKKNTTYLLYKKE